MWDAEFKKVIKDLLNLADQTQADIDFIDNVDSVADLQKAGLILEEIEEHIEALSKNVRRNARCSN